MTDPKPQLLVHFLHSHIVRIFYNLNHTNQNSTNNSAFLCPKIKYFIFFNFLLFFGLNLLI